MYWFSRLVVCLVAASGALSGCAFADDARSVWLVSNGFHTSLAFRSRDVTFLREVTAESRVDGLLIGWGAADYYRGKVNPWTCLKAIAWPSPGILHVVPIRGNVAARFRHSDVIELSLSSSQFRFLLRQIDDAFARDASGRRVFITRGYFQDSRFYLSRERFYFPKMCNVWVAQKLRRSGVPVFVPTAMVANDLVWQADKLGKRRQWLRRPLDAF